MTHASDRLLLVLPIQAFHFKGRIFLDQQACHGLGLWLENFEQIVLACPTHDCRPPPDRSPIDGVAGADRLSFVRLPVAYEAFRFFFRLPAVFATLREQISLSSHLHFAIGGLWGDWGAVAGLIAARNERGFVVWTDRVESAVISWRADTKGGFRRIYSKLYSIATAYYERYVIRRCTVGLFHGMDCFSAYAKYCKKPFLVHDIHLDQSDQISEEEVRERLSHRALQIVYAGRAHGEKGIFDWIEVLHAARTSGLDYRAVWYGDGPQLVAARERVIELRLGNYIQFPGAINDHQALMAKLKLCDVFLFCHLTPESPRCLIEALVCGLPLIGYDSPYQRDLIQRHRGGILTPIGDPTLVAKSLSEFLEKREQITLAARKDGMGFTAREVFKHRSELTRLASNT